jgi:putative CocE/NonD family hydrolase
VAVSVRYDVKIPMSDGVRLSADVYLPDAGGPFPVILLRTPYGNNERSVVADAETYVVHGYAFVAQDCRGKFDSEGEWYPYRHEVRDGDETLTWCGAQPWSNGRVGMTGGSYSAAVQWYAAASGNPHLKCIVPMVGFSDLFFDHGLRRAGVFQSYFFEWSVTLAGRVFFDVAKARREAATWHVPLATLDEALGFDLPYWKDFVRHEAYDDFWRALSIRDKYGSIGVPALGVGGWLSPWELQGVLTNFAGMVEGAPSAEARRRQKLVVGPWTHQLNSSRRVGEIDYGPEAVIDLDGLALRWFDRWLKGEPNGIEDEPPVRLFVMGENAWRDEPAWPPHARPTRYYLRSSGRANSLLGDGLLSTRPPPGDETATGTTPSGPYPPSSTTRRGRSPSMPTAGPSSGATTCWSTRRNHWTRTSGSSGRSRSTSSLPRRPPTPTL